MASFSIKSGISLRHLIRCIEVVLFVALALALADFYSLLSSSPGIKENPAIPSASHAVQARPAAQVSSGGVASGKLSPEVISLFGKTENPSPDIVHFEDVLKETALDLALKGILARKESDHKFALIAEGGGQEKVYRIGNRIAGAEIIYIEARRVVLLRNGIRESLTLEIAEPRRGDSFSTDSKPEVIAMAGGQDKQVSGSLSDPQMQHLTKLLNHAKTAPYRDNEGVEAGIRIIDIDPGSASDELGLLQEDIIIAVNGISVRNDKEALSAYQSFKSADARLGLLRDGREIIIDLSPN